MKNILWLLMLTLLWMLLQGSFTLLQLIIGAILSLALIGCMHQTLPKLPYHPWALLKFIGFMLYSLVLANLKIAQDILRPRMQNYPGIIAYKVNTKTEDQTLRFANMISLTPGTLVLDLSEDKRLLFIHAMFLNDHKTILEELKSLENHIMELLPA